MSAVLVTGASTPLGRALVTRLLGDPAIDRVLATDDAGGLTHPRLVSHPVDLAHPRELHRVLFGPARELGVDAVIHTAIRRDPAAAGPRVHRVNVDATRELVRLCERHPTVRRLVYRSFAEVYRLDSELPSVIGEDHPLDLQATAQWVRDRVEADVTVCTRMGMAPELELLVLRCAEVLAPDSGSQLWDYVRSRLCLRPLGYDPMLQLLSVADAARALHLALASPRQGVFNIPGADTLPLSAFIREEHRRVVPLPGPLLAPLYRLRRVLTGYGFRYDLNAARFHWGAVLDGTRAAETLGYAPEVHVIQPAAQRTSRLRTSRSSTSGQPDEPAMR